MTTTDLLVFFILIRNKYGLLVYLCGYGTADFNRPSSLNDDRPAIAADSPSAGPDAGAGFTCREPLAHCT
jgi:hypothetical protein